MLKPISPFLIVEFIGAYTFGYFGTVHRVGSKDEMEFPVGTKIIYGKNEALDLSAQVISSFDRDPSEEDFTDDIPDTKEAKLYHFVKKSSIIGRLATMRAIVPTSEIRS